MKRILSAVLTVTAGLGLVSAPLAGTALAAPGAGAPRAITVDAWVYPGPRGSATCSAPAEYGDGRVRTGALKAEYYTIDRRGTAVLLPASDPDYACNGYSPANAADVRAHSAHQYVTVSLADLDSERALTSSPQKRAAAITALVDFARSIGFGGIDIDFENYWAWTRDDRANFFTFLTELSAQTHRSGLSTQVEGPPDLTTGFNYGTALAAGVDQVVLMAYDLEYQTPNQAPPCLPFAPLDWVRELVGGALEQIPADRRSRLVVGLPSEAYTAPGDCHRIKGNLAMEDLRRAPGFSTDPQVVADRRDPGSGEVRWSSGGTFYNYVDQVALDAKLAVVRELGVSTVSVWALGGGNAWFSKAASGSDAGAPPVSRPGSDTSASPTASAGSPATKGEFPEESASASASDAASPLPPEVEVPGIIGDAASGRRDAQSLAATGGGVSPGVGILIGAVVILLGTAALVGWRMAQHRQNGARRKG
ncbi:hypothetical protein KNE206_69750 [Kitasatospora sp. NE20-6]|uniref:glycosyl hydrolase family 18 protein n=1 Tax=Kitasatospora sp. NE20-6 TaxID=2859066 RepID=UPI0034DBBCF0